MMGTVDPEGRYTVERSCPWLSILAWVFRLPDPNASSKRPALPHVSMMLDPLLLRVDKKNIVNRAGRFATSLVL